MSHNVFYTQHIHQSSECESDAASISSSIYTTTRCAVPCVQHSSSNVEKTEMSTKYGNRDSTKGQVVTTLLGTYLSDEMNFWFTFTLYGYYFSMATYGKREKSLH